MCPACSQTEMAVSRGDDAERDSESEEEMLAVEAPRDLGIGLGGSSLEGAHIAWDVCTNT
jgi:hypothetical protein